MFVNKSNLVALGAALAATAFILPAGGKCRISEIEYQGPLI